MPHRLVLAASLLIATAASVSRPSAVQDDPLESMRATYRGLQSFSATATMVAESQSPGGPLLSETHRITTRFRAPRHFYFDFDADAAAGADRVVIWCDGGDFQSWWKATGVHEVYSGGRGATAFALASYPTRGSALHIGPLIFPQAEMHGPTTDLVPAGAPSSETMAGRTVVKVSGEWKGSFGAARSTTVWIDSATLLIVKLVEDTPRGSPAGVVERLTTTFVPEANPPLEDGRFHFVVPGAGLR